VEIHSSQLATLHDDAQRTYADDLVAHVKEFFPAHAALGDVQLRRVVDRAIARANLHGFTSERNICLYLDLMLLYGADVDVDPQYPWFAEILADPAFPHPTLRVDHLTNTALAYLDRTAGADDEHLGRACLRLHREMDDIIVMIDRDGGGLWPPLAARVIRRVWPERAETLDEATLARTIRGAYDSAQHHGLAARRDLAIWFACAFVFGSGFAHDPQYPWAAAALARADGDPLRPAERLYRDGRACLRRLLGLEEVR
jgi:hypothetical protein